MQMELYQLENDGHSNQLLTGSGGNRLKLNSYFKFSSNVYLARFWECCPPVAPFYYATLGMCNLKINLLFKFVDGFCHSLPPGDYWGKRKFVTGGEGETGITKEKQDEKLQNKR